MFHDVFYCSVQFGNVWFLLTLFLAVDNNMYLPNSLTGTVIREEVGLTLDKAGKEVLGNASKVVLTKDTTTIVGDGSTQEAVNKRVAQIRTQIEVSLSLSPSLPKKKM